MLHRTLFLFRYLWPLTFIVLYGSTGCKQETSTETEEEETLYMADYETPSDHWGFLNKEGTLVIKAIYDDVGPFSEGLAAVNQGGKWGYINVEGKVVIEAIFKSAWAFHEGFARVLPFNGPDQFIDKTGKPLPSENWAAADDFSNGRARVKVGNAFGYVDVFGKLIIQPLYTRGWNFENGISVIEYQEKLGVINLTGENVLEPEYDQIKKVAGGSIILCKRGNTGVAFDKSGKELIKREGGQFIDSDGGLISVRQNGKMYLMQITEDAKKSSHYLNIIYLEENLWAGKMDSGYVVLNKEGSVINPIPYNQVNKFSDGFAAYSKGNFWGYLDTSGSQVTDGIFGLAWDYKEGFARAAFKDGIAFIGRTQTLAFYPPAGSLDMRDFSEGLAAVLID